MVKGAVPQFEIHGRPVMAEQMQVPTAPSRPRRAGRFVGAAATFATLVGTAGYIVAHAEPSSRINQPGASISSGAEAGSGIKLTGKTTELRTRLDQATPPSPADCRIAKTVEQTATQQGPHHVGDAIKGIKNPLLQDAVSDSNEARIVTLETTNQLTKSPNIGTIENIREIFNSLIDPNIKQIGLNGMDNIIGQQAGYDDNQSALYLSQMRSKALRELAQQDIAFDRQNPQYHKTAPGKALMRAINNQGSVSQIGRDNRAKVKAMCP